MPVKPIKVKHVLVLQYGDFNLSPPEVVDLKLNPEILASVDLEKGTWKPIGHELCPTCKGELKINETILNCSIGGEVIGLFDRRDTEQINRMRRLAEQAMKNRPI